MALLAVGLSIEVSSSIDADYNRSSSRVYYAWFNTGDDEFYVQQHCGFAIGSAHPTDTAQRCLAINASCQGKETSWGDGTTAAIKWQINVEYGYWNILERSPDGNPLHVPTRFRLDFTSNSAPAFLDVDGNPICNSAGDYFDPPVEYERLHATLSVMRNETGVNPATLAALSNTLNLNPWNGFPPKTVRLMPIKIPEIQYSQVTNTFYWPMQYEFEINFDTWVKQVLNQGYRQLDSGGKLVPIYINGQPIDTPVMLDEEGHAILTPTWAFSGGDAPGGDSGGTSGDPTGGGEPPEGGTGSSGAVVINAFNVYRTMDFSATSGGLNMDNLFTLPVL